MNFTHRPRLAFLLVALLFLGGLPASAAVYVSDFSAGVGGGAAISGNAVLTGGQLQLTQNLQSRFGTLLLPDAEDGVPAQSFCVTFNLTIDGHGVAAAADGFSVNFGGAYPTLSNSYNYENGAGNGLNFRFITYTSNAVYIGVNSIGITGLNFPAAVLKDGTKQPVMIAYDKVKGATLTYRGQTISVSPAQLAAAGYTGPKSGDRFLFGARTGGGTEDVYIDDVAAVTNTTPLPAPAFVLDGLVPAYTTWAARDANRNWYAVASSADGTRLVAVVGGGRIYTSIDSGWSWTPRESARNWNGVASSADGTRLVAVDYNGQIYTSTDAGVNWVPRETNRRWTSVACSADGNRIMATVNFGQILISTDGGFTWTPRRTPSTWISVASSADGMKLLAGASPSYLSLSTDGGLTWTERGPGENWVSVASSADGQRLVAAAQQKLYTSADGGVNWVLRTPNQPWCTVASSADGTKLLAAGNGTLFSSTDSGVNWVPRDGTRNWRGTAVSGDGMQWVATAYADKIYTPYRELTRAEDAPALDMVLRGVQAGPGGSALNFSATSSNASFVATPLFTYTSPAATGTMKLQVLPNAFGSAVVTAKVQDNGGTAGGRVDSLSQDFLLNVNAVNSPPSFTLAGNEVHGSNTTDAVTVPGFAMIDDGDLETNQTVIFHVTQNFASGQGLLIGNPSIGPNGTLYYLFNGSATGTMSFDVTMTDDTSKGAALAAPTTRTFSITRLATPINETPNFDAIADLNLLQDFSPFYFTLTGISSSGPAAETITITATSSNPALIPNPTVSYTSPHDFGFLYFTVAPLALGTATITVTVKDSGGTANGAIDTRVHTFKVNVFPVNHAPVFTLGPDRQQPYGTTAPQSFSDGAIGIDDGDADAAQVLTFTVSNDNPGLFTVPPAMALNGTLTYTPSGVPGTATVTVALRDDAAKNVPEMTTTKTFTITTTNLPTVVSNLNDSGPGSLRQIFANCVVNSGPDVITFTPGLAGTIAFSGEIVLTDLGAVTVDASNLTGGLILSGGGATRVLYVGPGASLTLRCLTLSGGNGVAGAMSSGNGNGGALANNGGALVLERCTLSGNTAATAGGALASFGGGTLTLSQCTLANNSTPGDGGAISTGSVTTLFHCTVSANTAAHGGGIVTAQTGNMTTVQFCILNGNTASPGGGGDVYNGTTFRRLGTNFELVHVNYAGSEIGNGALLDAPQLAPLDNYGGPTKTMALCFNSPARNFAFGSTITTDQRGFPTTNGPDLGAYDSGRLVDYHTWSWEEMPVSASPADRGASADFDRDGRSNLFEYATRNDPARGFANNVAPVTLLFNAAQTQLNVSFPIRFGAPDLLYTLERGSTPGTWTPIATYNSATDSHAVLVGGIFFGSKSAGNISFTETFIGQPGAFYRLTILQQ